MNERPLIRHWGRPWKFFSGEWKAPWETKLYEICSGREGEGGGSVVLLKSDENGPFHVVEATFALMGVWWRGSGQGWVDSSGRPATPPLEKQRAAFDAVKAAILTENAKQRYVFEIQGHELSARVHAIVDFLSQGGLREIEGGIAVHRFDRTGSFLVNGEPLDVVELEIPLEFPIRSELVVYDYWNHRMVVGRAGESWVLAEWSTSA